MRRCTATIATETLRTVVVDASSSVQPVYTFTGYGLPVVDLWGLTNRRSATRVANAANSTVCYAGIRRSGTIVAIMSSADAAKKLVDVTETDALCKWSKRPRSYAASVVNVVVVVHPLILAPRLVKKRSVLILKKPSALTKTMSPFLPLYVFFDIESMQVDGQVGETAYDDRPVRFLGETCLWAFLAWLDTLTLNGTRPLTVLAHNFQVYDSYLMVDELHRQKRLLKQIRNSGKMLQLMYDFEGATIWFIDSMSFFAKP